MIIFFFLFLKHFVIHKNKKLLDVKFRLLHFYLVKATGDVLTALYEKLNFTHYQELTLFGIYYLINTFCRKWSKLSNYLTLLQFAE